MQQAVTCCTAGMVNLTWVVGMAKEPNGGRMPGQSATNSSTTQPRDSGWCLTFDTYFTILGYCPFCGTKLPYEEEH